VLRIVGSGDPLHTSAVWRASRDDLLFLSSCQHDGCTKFRKVRSWEIFLCSVQDAVAIIQIARFGASDRLLATELPTGGFEALPTVGSLIRQQVCVVLGDDLNAGCVAIRRRMKANGGISPALACLISPSPSVAVFRGGFVSGTRPEKWRPEAEAGFGLSCIGREARA
jgi:hypothetical protein